MIHCGVFSVDLLGPHELHGHGESLIEESDRARGRDQPEDHVGPVVRHEGAGQGGGGGDQDAAQQGDLPPELVWDEAKHKASYEQSNHIASPSESHL